MPYNPNLNTVSRYGRTFDWLSAEEAFISPFFFMIANTTGVAGDLVQYSADDTVDLAASGVLRHQIAGFLVQDVKNLDGGPIRGWRNPYNSVENLGGNVGVLQSNGPAVTKRYKGTPAVGTRLSSAKDGKGQLEAYNSASNTGDPVAVVESLTSHVTPTVEPTQFTGSAPPDFIRIRIYNL